MRSHPVRLLAGVVGLTLIVGLAISTVLLLQGRAASPAAPAFTYAGTWTLLDLERHIDAGEIAAISAENPSDPASATLLARTTDGQTVRVQLNVSAGNAAAGLAALGHSGLFTSEAWTAAAEATPVGQASGQGDPLRSILGLLLPLALMTLFALVLFRVARNAGRQHDTSTPFATVAPRAAVEAARTGTAVGTATDDAVRLADVAGCDEAKLELTEAIDFLMSPDRFRKLGARIPRGIMLYGPPGTGKTMLAKAVATEAGVPFIYASSSEFVEKYVGVGAKRIRELFAQARSHGRSVIFFDEFDALGKARGGVNSHEEREQTLNQLLVEMDGFATTEDVVVIAATNRLDTIDPAVLRPGRFTRKIHVGLPDVAGRREILAVHARNKPVAEAADLDGLARKTYGFSGAQLADLLNEAAILAARRDVSEIEPVDLHGGWLKVAVGTGRRRSMDERERSIIAAHEIGHAICGRVHGDKRKIEEISLFAHGEALGVTVSSQEDNDLPSESDLRARLVALMGGRAAEELLFHEVTGGAANDFDKANQIATTMVTKWGMGSDPDAADGGRSGRGALSFLVARGSNNLPSEVQAAATRAIRAILDEAYASACDTLLANMTTLRRLAAYLVEQERIDGQTFDALFEGLLPVETAESEWRPVASRPRAWADIAPFHERRRVPREPAAAAITPVPAPEAQPVADEIPSPIAAAAEPAPPLKPSPRGALRSARHRRQGLDRRIRGLAAGYLRRAEAWLTSAGRDEDAEGA